MDADLFETYKEYLLGDYCYGLRTAESAGATILPWTLVLSYEHAIRKYACSYPGGATARGRPEEGLEGC